MGRRWIALLVMFAAVGLAAGPRTWTPEKWFDKARSHRIANYRIEATLDFEHKTLEGRETISWRNAGTAPTQELPLRVQGAPEPVRAGERGTPAHGSTGPARRPAILGLLPAHQRADGGAGPGGARRRG